MQSAVDFGASFVASRRSVSSSRCCLCSSATASSSAEALVVAAANRLKALPTSAALMTSLSVCLACRNRLDGLKRAAV